MPGHGGIRTYDLWNTSPRRKKKPVVPVSYREKIRVARSEINFFFEYFFHGFGGFLLGDLQ